MRGGALVGAQVVGSRAVGVGCSARCRGCFRAHALKTTTGRDELGVIDISAHAHRQ